VDIVTSVTGGRISVSITVLAIGACVCTIVSMTVDAACGELPVEDAAAPPSTATTEYVALRTKGSTLISRGERGNDDDNAKSEEFEMLRRMI
jgi:hypothetical protein